MFPYFFLINLLSNASYCWIKLSTWGITCIISSAGLFASVESLILDYAKERNLHKALFITFTCIHGLIILADYFLIINFNMVCGQSAIDILSETNATETNNFISTYLNIPALIATILSIVLLFYLFYLFSKKIQSKYIKYSSIAFSILGILCFGRASYTFIHFGTGMDTPQFCAPTRICHATLTLYQKTKAIDELTQNNTNVSATIDGADTTNIVVIIGESFSKYHCSLYGYDKPTYPHLKEWNDKGNLLVFDDVIATDDATHGNIKSIFSTSTNSDSFSKQPLFPVCFKSAGYKTALYDNQYIVGSGITFLTDERLSNLMFDYRNTHGYQYDGELIDNAHKQGNPYLVIYHLYGQHYTYANRYPPFFAKFNKTNYDNKYTERQRIIMAHYDNACLYNDYVVNKIIDKYKDDECLIFYFSDHGQEVFELGDYMGHGNAISSKDIRYQICVPFFVWASDSYVAKHPESFQKIKYASSLPLQTNDISHFLMDICNIKTPTLNPEHSIINERYDTSRHRIVMQSIDFDSKYQ